MSHNVQRKRYLLSALRYARACLAEGDCKLAYATLCHYRRLYDAAPASTKRRWRCGM